MFKECEFTIGLGLEGMLAYYGLHVGLKTFRFTFCEQCRAPATRAPPHTGADTGIDID